MKEMPARRIAGARGRQRDRLLTAAAIAVALVLATVVHVVCYAHGFYGISWDDAGRILDAAEWRRDTAWLRATAWLPLHRIAIGLALTIHPDLFVTPRAVTFLFGLGMLAAVIWLAAELFRDHRVVRVTALIGALFAPRVALSLAPLSDTLFGFVMVGAMAALARWLARPRRAWLLAAAIGCALATAIRYEGWLFAATCGAAVLLGWWHGRGRIGTADVLAVGGIVAAFPLLWIVLHAVENGDAFGFAAANGTAYADWWTVWRKNPLTEFLLVNVATLNALGLLSAAARSRTAPRFRTFLFAAGVPLLLTAAALFIARRAQSGPAWRMVVVWSVLLVPFTADVIARLGHRRRYARLVTVCAVGAVCLVNLRATYWIWRQSGWVVPAHERALGEEMARRLATEPAGAHAVIDTTRFSYLNVLVSSQRPEAFIPNALPERDDDPAAVIAASRPVPLAELRGRDVRFLLFRSNALRAVLDREPALRRAGDYGDWALYEMR